MLLGQYTKELHDNFGISFNELFTITNMPVTTQHRQHYPVLTQYSQH